MKRFILILVLQIVSISAFCQSEDTTLPYYKRFPVITPFEILLQDSVTMYKRSDLPEGKPVVFMIFSPGCNHCQEEAEQLVVNREKLMDVMFVMVTMHSFSEMKQFIRQYTLDQLPNVVVGRDIYYMTPAFYQFRHIPFHAMYDREGNLVSVFEGSVNINNVAEMLLSR